MARVSELRHYGDYIVSGELVERTTIHGSSTIDVQLNGKGEVIAVWFRCLSLPFTVSRTEDPVQQPDITVTAVEYVENG